LWHQTASKAYFPAQGDNIKFAGFTVIETIIFLAVSSALFVAVIVTVSGQQARAEFTYGVQEFSTRIEDVMNDVTTGFYQSNGSFRSTAPGGAAVVIAPIATNRGETADCILVGRVLQVGAAGVTGAPSPKESYRVMSVVGRRRVVAGGGLRDVGSLNESTTVLLTDVNAPGTVTTGVAPNGLQVGWIRVGGTSSPDYYAVGFFTTFSRYVDASVSVSGGVQVIPVVGSGYNQTDVNLVVPVSNIGASSAGAPASGVVICIQNSAATMHAELNLGGNLRQQSSDVNIKNGGC
jgi:hypothetical protein